MNHYLFYKINITINILFFLHCVCFLSIFYDGFSNLQTLHEIFPRPCPSLVPSFSQSLGPSVCLQLGQVSAAGVGQPARHLLHSEPGQPHQRRPLVIVRVRVVLVFLQPRPQHLPSLVKEWQTPACRVGVVRREANRLGTVKSISSGSRNSFSITKTSLSKGSISKHFAFSLLLFAKPAQMISRVFRSVFSSLWNTNFIDVTRFIEISLKTLETSTRDFHSEDASRVFISENTLFMETRPL